MVVTVLCDLCMYSHSALQKEVKEQHAINLQQGETIKRLTQSIQRYMYLYTFSIFACEEVYLRILRVTQTESNEKEQYQV